MERLEISMSSNPPNLDEAAKILYKSTAAKETEAVNGSVSSASPHQIAEAMTEKLESNSAEQIDKDSERANALFGENATMENGHYAGAMKSGLNRISDHFGVPHDEIAKIRTEGARTFEYLQMPAPEAQKYHDMYTEHVINPPDEKTKIEWATESRKQVREKYGKDGEALLEQAYDFVQSNKSLEKALQQSGLGSHPEIIMDLIERSQRLKRSGRFKPASKK
jgi:hypothetical protein